MNLTNPSFLFKNYFRVFILFFVIGSIATIGCSNKQNSSPDTAETETDGSFPADSSIFAMGDTLEVTGKIICAHCYALNEENTGHDHTLPQSGFREDCAEFCSLQGYPIAVLLDEPVDGSRVWVMRTASQIFADYMTRTAKIEGTFASKGVIDPLSIFLEEKTEEKASNWVQIM